MNDQCLLINSDWRPLRILPWKRAIILVLEERAEVIHESDQEIHSPSQTFKIPSVLRLKKMIKIPLKAQIPLSRRALKIRDDGKCQYCGDIGNSIDHVRPKSRGGNSDWLNLVLACGPCNKLKADRLLSEISDMKLIREPFVPSRKIWIIAGIKEKEAWLPYLNEVDLISA